MKKTLTVKGFPGWHVECTAMGCHYLGEKFDIHTGGIDHIPVHHTNEIAQAEGAFGHDHVNVWMHNEFLLSGNEKMAKSTGDFLRLQTVLDKGFDALDYRYFLLQTHYRKAVTFSWEALEAAKTARKRLNDKIIELKDTAESVDTLTPKRLEFQGKFVERITDDLDVPGALALLHDMLKSDLSAGEKLSLAVDWDQVFGLGVKHVHKPQFTVPKPIEDLAQEREKARQDKDWTKADEIRDKLKEAGWTISDTPEGPKVEPTDT